MFVESMNESEIEVWSQPYGVGCCWAVTFSCVHVPQFDWVCLKLKCMFLLMHVDMVHRYMKNMYGINV
jgi:hypothetical protein